MKIKSGNQQHQRSGIKEALEAWRKKKSKPSAAAKTSISIIEMA